MPVSQLQCHMMVIEQHKTTAKLPERMVEAKKRPRDTEGTVSLVIVLASWMKKTTMATTSKAMAR